MLDADTLQEKTFLDVGCGSGLFSLAASRLGATVRSFDADPQSVECARTLRTRFAQDPSTWIVEPGSVLDVDYLRSLGSYDIVYAWGVLHHTGAMWPALEHVLIPLRTGGTLFVSLYNDQGARSVYWRRVKRLYNRLPGPLQSIFAGSIAVPIFGVSLLRALGRGERLRTWLQYDSKRGMSRWHDLIDWIGGYPFEVATPADIAAFYERRGLVLVRHTSVGTRLGCNEFIFRFADTPA